MSLITLDVTNILNNSIGVNGIDEETLNNTCSILSTYNETLQNSPYPFMSMPFERYQYDMIKEHAERLKNKSVKNLVLLGIGGSALGTETIFRALLSPLYNMLESERNGKPRYFIIDNIDPHTIETIRHLISREADETLVIAISKSGETAETISQFMIFQSLLSSTASYRDRIIVVTGPDKGMLNTIAKNEGYPVLNVPPGVGGRFSVLTPVGMLPAACMGVNIDEIMDGAAYMASIIKNTDSLSNPAVVTACILYLMDQSQKSIHVMMPYSDRLSSFADWFRQLEAESLGKQGVGPTPVKALGVTDQHSQLQLYMEGPCDKCILFLYAAGGSSPIPASFSYLDELSYLSEKDMDDLFHAEFNGTRLSLTEKGIPNMTVSMNEVDAYTLGALFFLFEMVIVFMGQLYGINPFDQPGVERGKIYTKAIMGKKGLENVSAEIQGRVSGAKKIFTF